MNDIWYIFIVPVDRPFVLNMLLNYAAFCVCVLYILYMSCVLMTFVNYIQYLARVSDLSILIDILDDDVNVYLTASIDCAGSRMISVASTITSSGWVPFTCLLFVIFYLHI